MKTKIVYVVSSDEKDVYLEQTMLSAFSLKMHNPDAFVELVVDQRTDATISGKRTGILQFIDQKAVVNVPMTFDKAQTSRWLKTSLRKYVERDFLFIDSDTIITEDLSNIDYFEGDIGAVLNVHILAGTHPNRRNLKFWAKRDGWNYSDDLKYFNSGVLIVKDTPKAHQLFDSWHKRWNDGLSKHHHVFDQTYLAAANEECSYPIKELDGIWNCQIVKNGMKYLYGAKIMHYLAYEQYSQFPMWRFYDKTICLSIKESGKISEEIESIVVNAKSSFADLTEIVTGKEFKLIHTRLFGLLLNLSKIILPIDNFVNVCIYYAKHFLRR